MIRRAGMSLTEVLVALFILTIGVIGILTMFPLGAVQMARAVRDDRSALAASNADAYMRWYWATYVANQSIGNPINWPNQDQLLSNGSSGLFDNPYMAYTVSGGQATAVAPLQNFAINLNNNLQQQQQNPNLAAFNVVGQVSYPVIVDPLGFQARQWNFGDAPNFALIPRCPLYYGAATGTTQIIQTQANITTGNVIPQPHLQVFNYRSCSLVDSLGYNDNGTPTNDLEMRYNWLWVLQRPEMTMNSTNSNPQNQNPNNNLYNNANGLSKVNMTVVVFDRRAFLYPPSNVQGFEIVMGATFTTGLSTVTISNAASQAALDLKPGTWVMDATINPAANPFPIMQANFYRVVSVVQVNGQVNLELQTPIIPPVGYPPLGFSYPGTLVALNGVSGVFVRPPLTPYP